MKARDAQLLLKSIGCPEKARLATRFFKTGPGQYGEGDIFLGIPAKVLHATSREYRALPLEELKKLLLSPIHEERMLALLVLVIQVKKTEESHRKAVYDFYLSHTTHINNWDLVDVSAPHIVGGYLFDKPRTPLTRLSKSRLLWERRISIVSTQHFIRKLDFSDTLRISEALLTDQEDLIHKATGWMLREVGQKDLGVLESFLNRHAATMPRTRSIRQFPPMQRRRKEHRSSAEPRQRQHPIRRIPRC